MHRDASGERYRTAYLVLPPHIHAVLGTTASSRASTHHFYFPAALAPPLNLSVRQR